MSQLWSNFLQSHGENCLLVPRHSQETFTNQLARETRTYSEMLSCASFVLHKFYSALFGARRENLAQVSCTTPVIKLLLEVDSHICSSAVQPKLHYFDLLYITNAQQIEVMALGLHERGACRAGWCCREFHVECCVTARRIIVMFNVFVWNEPWPRVSHCVTLQWRHAAFQGQHAMALGLGWKRHNGECFENKMKWLIRHVMWELKLISFKLSMILQAAILCIKFS